MLVRELKEYLENLPDNCQVLIEDSFPRQVLHISSNMNSVTLYAHLFTRETKTFTGYDGAEYEVSWL
jgi:hypothetical protein